MVDEDPVARTKRLLTEADAVFFDVDSSWDRHQSTGQLPAHPLKFCVIVLVNFCWANVRALKLRWTPSLEAVRLIARLPCPGLSRSFL